MLIVEYDKLISLDLNKRSEIFKDKRMVYRTKSLFFEYRHPEYPVLFTLKDYDLPLEGGTIRSLKQIYLSLNDPEEYRIATEVFTSLDHWRRLTQLGWFNPSIELWREELEVKLRSEAIDHLRNQAANSTSAAQFLAKGSWKDKRGRPSREEKEAIQKREGLIQDEVDELYSRAIN